MASIVHLYSAIGSLNQGLRSHSLCTGVRCTRLSLEVIAALHKYGFISHYHFPPTGGCLAKKNTNNRLRRAEPFLKNGFRERRILVFFRWSLFDKGVQLRVRSSPGHRKFLTIRRIHKLIGGGREMFFLSTSKGIMSASEALNLNIGGEILFSLIY